MDEIVFSAKYGTWISIKKMSIDEKTSPAEVAYMLAGIMNTVGNKGFAFLGIDTAKIDAYTDKLVGSKRKSYGAVSEIMNGIKPSELKAELLTAIMPGVAPLPLDKSGNPVPFDAKLPLAEAYFMRSLMARIGFDFNISGDVLSKMYPDIKFPKPKGNFGKKKA
jgi:hypothetical protein